MRVGVSYISKRYCKASNEYVSSYDCEKPAKHIICFYENNLYG